MNRRLWIVLLVAAAVIGIGAFALHHYFSSDLGDPRETALALIPADTNSVVFADFKQLRTAPFFSTLSNWVPQPQQVDAEYAKFLRDTGFDYERDLDRVAIATIKRGQTTEFFVVGDGRFDRKKINTYISQFGTHDKTDGREVFTAPLKGSARKVSFVFLHQNRIALTDDPDLASMLRNPIRGDGCKSVARTVRSFGRLALVCSLSPGCERWFRNRRSHAKRRASTTARFAPRSVAVDHARWCAGKNRLRLVAEGECPNDPTAHDLADVLNGIRLFAQAGLNDSKVRHQLDDQTREAYIDLVHSADITRLDRGETKSVRLVLEITSEILKTARSTAAPLEPAHHEQSPAISKK